MAFRVLGLITARGGSKGLPGKNIRPLNGKPLLAWTIEDSQESKLLTRTILSTDDPEIAEIGRQYGADVPFMRPPELATDTATSMQVMQHALKTLKEQGEEYDAAMFLQPTSPLRTGKDIDDCIQLMIDTGCDSVFTMVKLTNFTRYNLKRIEDGKILPLMEEEGPTTKQRQTLPDAYKRNSAVFLTRTQLLEQGDMFGKDSRAVIVGPERSVDIDTLMDFEYASFLMDRLVESKQS